MEDFIPNDQHLLDLLLEDLEDTKGKNKESWLLAIEKVLTIDNNCTHSNRITIILEKQELILAFHRHGM